MHIMPLCQYLETIRFFGQSILQSIDSVSRTVALSPLATFSDESIVHDDRRDSFQVKHNEHHGPVCGWLTI